MATREFLIQYGSSAFVGRFRADTTAARGDCVVIESPRGVELGTVLCEPHEQFVRTVSVTTDGQVLRPATPEDMQATADDFRCALLDAANNAVEAEALPALFLDCEVLLERTAAILHVTTWATVDLTPLAESLTTQFGLPIRLQNLTTSPVAVETEAGGCGKEGCGSAGGGCSSCGSGCGTGEGCSKGKVKSSGELTAYFRDLRDKMERQLPAGRRELL